MRAHARAGGRAPTGSGAMEVGGARAERTARSGPDGIVHAKHGPIQVFAAVLNDRPLRRGIRRDPRVAFESALNVEEAVLRDELLGILHVEGVASHGHARVRRDDRAPALLLPPLADLGKGSAVRLRRPHLRWERGGRRDRRRSAPAGPLRLPPSCSAAAATTRRIKALLRATSDEHGGAGTAATTRGSRYRRHIPAMPPPPLSTAALRARPHLRRGRRLVEQVDERTDVPLDRRPRVDVEERGAGDVGHQGAPVDVGRRHRPPSPAPAPVEPTAPAAANALAAAAAHPPNRLPAVSLAAARGCWRSGLC